ncbi:MAG: protein-tyrosine phosphatase family protein [Gammaproteobacteria bacterium]|nr:protein-tyrosine phosphatase family protein [Gammaproteobacteria bacterium]
MRSFTEITEEWCKKAISLLPFGEDYRHVNALKSLMQQKKRLESQLGKFTGSSSLSSEQADLLTLSFNSTSHLEQELLHAEDITDEQEKKFNTSKTEFSDLCKSYGIDEKKAIEIATGKLTLENQLTHLESKLNEEIIPFFNSILLKGPKNNSPWQKNIHEHFTKLTIQHNAENFINYINATSDHYLPEIYAEEAGQRFPSSANNAYNSGFAHFQACKNKFTLAESKAGLLASRAPKKSGGLHREAQDDEALQSFLKMLFDLDVKYILALGPTGDRLDYKAVSANRYQTQFDEKNNIITIADMLDAENPIFKRSQFSHFGVADQKQLNPSDTELAELLQLYNAYKRETVLVHCDSGVGRTGQIRLLFGVLDSLSSQTELQFEIAELIDALINKREYNPIKLIKKMIGIMSDTLNELRQTRYCVETEAQFSGSLPTLLVLIAFQKKCYSEKELCDLREALGVQAIKAHYKENVKKKSSVTEFVIESDSDSEPSTPAVAAKEQAVTPKPPTSTPGKSRIFIRNDSPHPLAKHSYSGTSSRLVLERKASVIIELPALPGRSKAGNHYDRSRLFTSHERRTTPPALPERHESDLLPSIPNATAHSPAHSQRPR